MYTQKECNEWHLGKPIDPRNKRKLTPGKKFYLSWERGCHKYKPLPRVPAYDRGYDYSDIPAGSDKWLIMLLDDLNINRPDVKRVIPDDRALFKFFFTNDPSININEIENHQVKELLVGVERVSMYVAGDYPLLNGKALLKKTVEHIIFLGFGAYKSPQRSKSKSPRSGSSRKSKSPRTRSGSRTRSSSPRSKSPSSGSPRTSKSSSSSNESSSHRSFYEKFDEAVYNSDFKTVKKLKLNADKIEINDAFMLSASKGQIENMKILKKWGADAFNWAFVDAAENGQLQALKLLKRWGANDYFDAILKVGDIRSPESKLLKKWLLSKANFSAEELRYNKQWLNDHLI